MSHKQRYCATVTVLVGNEPEKTNEMSKFHCPDMSEFECPWCGHCGGVIDMETGETQGGPSHQRFEERYEWTECELSTWDYYRCGWCGGFWISKPFGEGGPNLKLPDDHDELCNAIESDSTLDQCERVKALFAKPTQEDINFGRHWASERQAYLHETGFLPGR